MILQSDFRIYEISTLGTADAVCGIESTITKKKVTKDNRTDIQSVIFSHSSAGR